jgi:hypothetical protein
MASRKFGDVWMEIEAATAFIKFEFLRDTIDYGGGLERARQDYAAHHYNCAGEFVYTHHFCTWSRESVPCGILHDIRTLALLRQRCCPMELSEEMIEGYE